MNTAVAAQLKEMRQNAGFHSARAAAEQMGVPVPTYLQHENGRRACSIAQFERYEIFFHTTQLVARFLKDRHDIPQPDVLAAIVYDVIHKAQVWKDAPVKTVETYTRGVEAVLRAHGVTVAGQGPKAAPGASGGPG